ncbi:alpha/beta hydrolase [Nocardioides cavernaquae]|uniref:Alpha/beta hydrolase n=2 Tax=Nocardioides cavernaquae TaxID=2321396 RepID=A0A3A5H6T7_9ACTN|nr:alpha/beta hydrolase [Nocardioides cavernaquae]
MVIWVNDQFELGKNSFGDERVVVMRRTDRERPNALVVLIHGLAGSGYGTWHHIPRKILTSNLVNADVAVADYPSAWRQLRKKPALPVLIDLLCDQLQTLDYKSIVLVGHSMGGLLAGATVRQWQQTLSPPLPVETIAGLIFVASPRAGSKWPVPTKERRVLGIHSPLQTLNDRFFSSHVDATIERSGSGPLKVPCFAVTADNDMWVDPFSSGLGITDAQRQTLPGTHTSVMRTDSFWSWMDRRLADLLQVHKTPTHPEPGWNELTTQFRGDPRHGVWEDVYRRVLEQYTEQSLIPLRDVPGTADGVGLRMRVVASDSALQGSGTAAVGRDTEDHAANRIRALGVATFGSEEAAHHAVTTAVGTGEKRWVTQVASISELESEMTNWLSRVAINSSLETRHRTARRRDLSDNEESFR